jgi:predicted DNA-binding transcriptional regulator YafY
MKPMRRADRLFQIVNYLRGRRLTTARQLASWLGISERTVYRDIRDLSLSGVPVEGEAGIGYRLRAEFDLPPLMFDLAEIEALTIGARMVQSWGSPELAKAAEAALAKIAAILPAGRRTALERTRLFALRFEEPRFGAVLDTLRRAIANRAVTVLDYRDVAQRESLRPVWPLGLYFWGGSWTLAAWCELRTDFRNFRLDRVVSAISAEREYPDQEGRRLEDFVRVMRGREER